MRITIIHTMLVAALGMAFSASAALAATGLRIGWQNRSGLGFDQRYGDPNSPELEQQRGLEQERDLGRQADPGPEQANSRDLVKAIASQLAQATQGLQHAAVRFAAHGAADDTSATKALEALHALDTRATGFSRELRRSDPDLYRLREDYRLLLSTYRKAAYTKHYLHRQDSVDDRFAAVSELVYGLRPVFDRVYGEIELDGPSGVDPGHEPRIGFRMQVPFWTWNHNEPQRHGPVELDQ